MHVCSLASSDEGSSPLTRGKHNQAARPRASAGLIPAHAGKTVLLVGGVGTAGAHPRSRGENGAFGRARSWTTGSSPLTRGKRYDDGQSSGRYGLIPAHAGKTPPVDQGPDPPWAHPRSRGENAARSAATPISSGSSPLTRGKHDRVRPREGRAGLIPAHAGKTITLGILKRPSCGSSPLTRGKHPVNRLPMVVIGLIPAHAGKTTAASGTR